MGEQGEQQKAEADIAVHSRPAVAQQRGHILQTCQLSSKDMEGTKEASLTCLRLSGL